MSHQCEHEHDHHHDSPPPATNNAQSLFSFVNTPNVQCLNTNSHGSSDSAACFIKSRDDQYDVSKYLESDADCQMILHIPFTCICRIFSLVLRTSRSSSGTTSPKTIKIFKNFSKNIDFDTLEDSKPQHEVEHPRDVGIDLDGAPRTEITDTDDSSFVEHHLPRHLFQNAHSLTLFMQSAWGDDEDITRCFYLEMRGESTGQKRGNNAVPLLTVYESAPNPVDHQKLENEQQGSSLGM